MKHKKKIIPCLILIICMTGCSTFMDQEPLEMTLMVDTIIDGISDIERMLP